MKQMVVLSGKGGTGKTAITAALAHLLWEDSTSPGAVLVDADVDAANLELLVGSSTTKGHEFMGNDRALIDPSLCLRCGICEEVCRFGAVRFSEEMGLFEVDPMGCEGCASCYYQCPEGAISMAPRLSGFWYESESRFGPLFHARLEPAQENSGKLVSLVKSRARETTLQNGRPLMLVDGPPGIACPAIAALSGADLVLIVAEPTVAGLCDLERARAMAAHFRAPTLVCINKADLDPDHALSIRERCEAAGVPVVGSVPFDETVTDSLVAGRPVTDHDPAAPASRAIEALWQTLKGALTSC